MLSLVYFSIYTLALCNSSGTVLVLWYYIDLWSHVVLTLVVLV